jgi:hypothetical protein
MSTLETTPRRSSRPVINLLLLLAVYILSCGPVMALYSSRRIDGPVPELMTTFYQPVNWLHAHTPLGSPMGSYDNWWKGALKRS